jgi:hypothetical protein
LRSCDVAPAFAAAMQTMPPTMSAIGWYASPVQPSATKTRHVAMSVAMVIPEIGFDELPMIPTMRLDTVTKKKPKTTTRSPVRSDPGKAPGSVREEGDDGDEAMAPPTTIGERQVALGALARRGAALPARRSRSESRKLPTIVGSERMSVITPAQATAPAPMYRMYAR